MVILIAEDEELILKTVEHKLKKDEVVLDALNLVTADLL